MNLKYLIIKHPWNMLKEAVSFPSNDQISVLKGVMDGKDLSTISKELGITIKETKIRFMSGMKNIGGKSIYDLVLWGLRTGVIEDKPINADFSKFPKYEAQPTWAVVLNSTLAGYSDDDISKEARISKDTIKHHRDLINKKFGLDGSLASYIRFAFAALNPISPPKKAVSPWLPWTKSTTSLMRIPQTRTPSMIDPEGIITKKTGVWESLKLLGVKPNEIPKSREKSEKGGFWTKSYESLMYILELAKKKRDDEIKLLAPIANRHSDNPDEQKKIAMAEKQMAVVNSAWERIKELFGRNGYVLPEDYGKTFSKKLRIPGTSKSW